MSEKIVKTILTPEEYTKYDFILLIKALGKVAYCDKCQKPLSVPDHISKENPFENCPNCSTLLCLNCWGRAHRGIFFFFDNVNLHLKGKTCQEAGHMVPEDLIKKFNMKQCSKCLSIVEKEHGCNHMFVVSILYSSRGRTCVCKNEFCYVCGETFSTTHKDACPPGCKCFHVHYGTPGTPCKRVFSFTC